MKVHLHRLPLDLAANAAGPGALVLRASTREQLAGARLADSTTVVVVETGPLLPAPDSASWWDVPVAEVATRPAALAACERYDAERPRQRSLLSGTAAPEPPGSH